MKSNYEPLGKHIRLVDYRNSEEVTSTVLGISIDKEFMPSVANVIGTDLSRYKLISKGLFACNPMHVGRDERLPIALYEKDNAAIVSPAYFMFEIIDRDVLNEEYLMMWFRRPEFDRECWFMTDGSVRGGITWDDLCRIKLPVPSYARQCEIVESYRAITNRIALKRAEMIIYWLQHRLFTSRGLLILSRLTMLVLQIGKMAVSMILLSSMIQCVNRFPLWNEPIWNEHIPIMEQFPLSIMSMILSLTANTFF